MVNEMKQNFILDAGIPPEKEKLISKKKEKNLIMKHFLITEKDEKNWKTKKGDYYTIHFDDSIIYKRKEDLQKNFAKIFKTFLAKYQHTGPILFIGLGNSSLLADSFGVKVVNNLIATNNYNDFLTIPKVALFTPETTNKTGISSFKLIEMVVNHLNPDVIVLIDSFLTKELKYINRSIELNDCGIIFANELRSNKKIDKETFSVPVLSIGLPTIWKNENMMVTKYNLDMDLSILSEVIANAIKQILFF